MEAPSIVQATTVLRKVVTIPATGGTASTLATLGSLTAAEQAQCVGVKVCGLDTAGSDRAAFVAGDSTSSLPQVIASAVVYSEPAYRDAIYTYVKSSAAAITNVCVLFYQGVNVG